MAIAARAAQTGAFSIGSRPNAATIVVELTSWICPPKLWIFSVLAASVRPTKSGDSGDDPVRRSARRKAMYRRSHRTPDTGAGSVRDTGGTAAVGSVERSVLGRAPCVG